jgi:hypothetical protein
VDVLCEACEQLKWKSPSKIQKEAIPIALQGTVLCSLKIVAWAGVYFHLMSTFQTLVLSLITYQN